MNATDKTTPAQDAPGAPLTPTAPNAPHAPAAQDALEAGAFLAQLDRFYRELDEIYHEASRAAGLSDSAFDILYSLMLEDGLTQKQLGERGFAPKQTVASAVRRLEDQGLIAPDAGCRRNAPLRLTEAGRAAVEERVRPAYHAERRAIERLAPAERAMLAQLLARYTTALRDELGVS